MGIPQDRPDGVRRAGSGARFDRTGTGGSASGADKRSTDGGADFHQIAAGSTVVQVVSYVGYRLGGWFGSAIATAAFVLPSAVGMTLLAVLYVAVSDVPVVGAALKGLAAAVVGLLVATTFRLGQSNVKETSTLVIAGAAFAGAFFGVNAAVVVVIAGLIGLLILRAPTPQKSKDGGGA